MIMVEFKQACKAHRALCPYRNTSMKTCGANVKLTEEGKCPKGEQECYYMSAFKKRLRNIVKDGK